MDDRQRAQQQEERIAKLEKMLSEVSKSSTASMVRSAELQKEQSPGLDMRKTRSMGDQSHISKMLRMKS